MVKNEKIGAIAVVGGGIAGIQASLDLADFGFKVYLIDSAPSIGGKMSQLDKTFPTMDCSICIQAPKMVEVERHPNIELFTFSELVAISGSKGSFNLEILKKARFIDEEKCTGCGLCVDACLLRGRIPNEFNEGTDKRGAIYIPFSQAVPLKALIDKEKCIYIKKGKCGKFPACKNACPADAIDFKQKDKKITINAGSIILAQGYNIFNDIPKRYKPFHPDVVTSLQFERLICASGPMEGHLVKPSDGKEPKRIGFIQCVGSRCKENELCSSVCCVYATKEAIIVKEHNPEAEIYIFYIDLRAFGKGFEEFVVRARDEYGINYIKTRVSEVIEEEGKLFVQYEGEDSIARVELDMIVLSVGLMPSKSTKELSEICSISYDEYGFFKTEMDRPVETDIPGIYVCGCSEGPMDIPDSVCQASGAACKAEALLAEVRNSLTVKKEYPPEKEISGDLRIGVFICECGINIGGVVDVPKVAEYTKTLSNVAFVNVNKYTCSKEGNEIIKNAIREYNLNRVVVASCTPRTHEPLFQNTCREASLNPYLFEFVNIRDQCSWVHAREPERATNKACDLVRMGVAKARLLNPLRTQKVPVIQRALVIGGGISGMTAALDIASQGFFVYLVEKESELGGILKHLWKLHNGKRNSDILNELIKMVESNERIAVYKEAEIQEVEGYVGNFKAKIKTPVAIEEIEFGAVIIAVGGKELKPEGYYEYGKKENVVTQMEFEKMLEKGELNQSCIVMIQCVGSRNDERQYCSRICCTEACKNAITAKEKSNAEVFVLYRDMRTYGYSEILYKKAREKGVLFIRYTEEKSPRFENGVLSVFDSLLGEEIEIKPDLVVLSCPIIANERNEKFSKMFKVPLDANGFFLEAHVKLYPMDFATDGVFLCGAAHSPRLIDECISQASGAVSRACRILSAKEGVETEAIISLVDEEKCVGCGICESVCPYGAIEVVEKEKEGRKANVTVVKCKGCGTCGSSCIKEAITMQHFSNEQLVSQEKAALEIADSMK